MIEWVVVGLLGAISVGVHVYSIIRIRDCMKAFDSLPSPEEMALEVLKVKLPVESLPPDMQEQYAKKQHESYIG